MERDGSANIVEKQRLRNAIADQVQRFLRDGGHITVIDGPQGVPDRALHGAAWDEEYDLVDATD